MQIRSTKFSVGRREKELETAFPTQGGREGSCIIIVTKRRKAGGCTAMTEIMGKENVKLTDTQRGKDI